MFAVHTEEYSYFYSRSRLEFAPDETDFLPMEKRLNKRAEQGKYAPNLAALLYNYGRYLLISCSRPGTQAANLQGIWSVGLNPPWGSQYTTNINLEMNYWPSDPTGLPECAEPLFHLISNRPARTHNRKRTVSCRWLVHPSQQ
jgi:alpha-L-fucosidase 2